MYVFRYVDLNLLCFSILLGIFVTLYRHRAVQLNICLPQSYRTEILFDYIANLSRCQFQIYAMGTFWIVLNHKDEPSKVMNVGLISPCNWLLTSNNLISAITSKAYRGVEVGLQINCKSGCNCCLRAGVGVKYLTQITQFHRFKSRVDGEILVSQPKMFNNRSKIWKKSL